MNTALTASTSGISTAKARVALVTRHDCSAVTAIMSQHGHELVQFADGIALREASAQSPFDLVLHDDDRVDAIGDPGCPIVPIGSLAIANARLGNAQETGWETVFALAVALAQTSARCRDLERTVSGIHNGSALIGRTAVMRRLAGTIARAADCDATILIEGPAGSGKSLVARMIHCKSRRSHHALLAIDAASSTVETLGKALVDARDTTLIVEDVERLPAPAQATLVRHLKERSVAGASPRVVATTAAHLPELVARGAFREDLLYRLHTLPIQLPSLRERVEDIEPLVTAIANAGGSTSTKVTFTRGAIAQFEAMPWPGNVAQLEATVRKAVLLAGGGVVDREHVVAPVASIQAPAANGAKAARRPDAEPDAPSEESILPFEQEEQRMFARALSATKGNVRRAAQLLGIGRATLYRKIQQYQLRLH